MLMAVKSPTRDKQWTLNAHRKFETWEIDEDKIYSRLPKDAIQAGKSHPSYKGNKDSSFKGNKGKKTRSSIVTRSKSTASQYKDGKSHGSYDSQDPGDDARRLQSL